MERKLNSRRYCPGCYDVTYRDRTFRVWSDEYQSRQSGYSMTSPHNTWGIVETTVGIDGDGYWNHFATKGDCLDVIREACDKDAAKQVEVGARNCDQCGRDMGYEWLLGPVCGKCCRKNHRDVAGR